MRAGAPADSRCPAGSAAWFAAHPEVEAISRDRAGVYAEGARAGAPQVLQVADRFHVLHNLTDALQRVVARHHPALRRAVEAAPPRPRATLAPAAPTAPVRPPNQRARRRQARFDEIQRLYAAGASLTAIAAQFGMGRQTVRRYLRAGGPPADYRGRRPSPGAPFDAYLRERCATGEQNISALCREIRARGFTGGLTSVWDYVSPWRTTPGRRGPAARRPVGAPGPPPPDRRMPSSRQATWWLLADPAELEPDQRAIAAHLLGAVPAIQRAHALVQTFAALLRERRASGLADWLGQAAQSGIPEFVGVARSLRQDLQAVQAAFDSRASNGQTEGRVTRIKLIKRQCYGRANFDLLRLRLLYRDTPDDAPP